MSRNKGTEYIIGMNEQEVYVPATEARTMETLQNPSQISVYKSCATTDFEKLRGGGV
jgi:hypothetical protein